jgi:hypothetical protein
MLGSLLKTLLSSIFFINFSHFFYLSARSPPVRDPPLTFFPENYVFHIMKASSNEPFIFIIP